MEIWKPPVELSRAEQFIVKHCSKRRVFIFLRELRHLIFDDEVQGQLIAAYAEVERGKARVAPARLGLALLLQAALRVPDHEVPKLTLMDKRWQMVLDCFDIDEPLFSQGSFLNFRQRLIEHGLDEVLFDKTVKLARETGGFSATRLRAAFDASPLWGAGRVEDTFNLIGRAALQVVRSAAERLNRSVEQVAQDAGIPVLTATSIKTGLDIDVPAQAGGVSHFPAKDCDACPKRSQCTRAATGRGRSITVHAQESFFIQLRRAVRTPEGRAALRQRVQVEHGLAGIQNRQGDRARYPSQRKNLFDLRRYAALNNLSVVDQLHRAA